MLIHLRIGATRRCSHGRACGLVGTSVASVDATLGLWKPNFVGRSTVGSANGTYCGTAGRNCLGCGCVEFWLAALRRLDNLVIEYVESSAEDDPLDHVLVALAKRLPYCFLFRRLSGNGDTRAASTSATSCGIFLNLAKLDSLWWNEVTGVGEVEHGPPCCVGIGFGNLEERLLVTRRVGIWQSEFVDGSVNACIGDGPFEIARGFATHRLVAMPARVTTIRGSRATSSTGGRYHLCDTEVALWGRSEKVGLLVKVGVDVRVEGVVWLAIRSYDEGGEMVRNGRMVWRCVDGVDCRHGGQRRVGSVWGCGEKQLCELIYVFRGWLSLFG